MEGILVVHDRQQFDVICYSDLRRPDAVTAKLKQSVETWRDVSALNDDRLEQLIRDDQIDILVDLAGHMSRNRMVLFSRQPAPVQVTYLGYPNTTGVAAMQYRITDADADPPGTTDRFHSETLHRLPRCAWCYRPPIETRPEVLGRSTDRFTFASLNRVGKITPKMMDVWGKILRETGARLLCRAGGTIETNRGLLQQFRAHGIDEGDVVIVDHLPRVEYERMVGTVDVALDTFPYHGTTTTCDALWAGVPVVTLAGSTHVSRVGVSLLNAVGLPQLVARDADDYVLIAMGLATDPTALQRLRHQLRSGIEHSPLLDAAGLARALECAYRAFWKRWYEET